MLKFSLSKEKLRELVLLFYAYDYAAYVGNLWYDEERKSFKTSEHTADQFADKFNDVKLCLSKEFSSWNTVGYYNDKSLKIIHKEKIFKAFLNKGKRYISHSLVRVSLTMDLKTGRIHYYYSSGKYKIVRNYIAKRTQGNNEHRFLLAANTYQVMGNICKILLGDIIWLKDIQATYTFEDIVACNGSPKLFILRRFKKNIPLIFLYHDCPWIIKNYDFKDLFTISQFIKNKVGSLYSTGEAYLLSTYWVNRYDIGVIEAGDYYNICRSLAVLPRIRFENKAHFLNNHIKLALTVKVKHINFVIPDKIPLKIENDFLNLKLIQTGVGLYKEGVEMNHCVNTYANDIESQHCFIYKGTVLDKRVTIEVKKDFNKETDLVEYTPRQVKGKKDEKWTYITHCVNTYFKKNPIQMPISDLNDKNTSLVLEDLPF